jgi:hypothetical protein
MNFIGSDSVEGRKVEGGLPPKYDSLSCAPFLPRLFLPLTLAIVAEFKCMQRSVLLSLVELSIGQSQPRASSISDTPHWQLRLAEHKCAGLLTVAEAPACLFSG